MSSLTFAYLRRKAIDLEVRLIEAEAQIGALSELVNRLVRKHYPGIRFEQVDEKLFQTEDDSN
jgi:hypothetical protein